MSSTADEGSQLPVTDTKDVDLIDALEAIAGGVNAERMSSDRRAAFDRVLERRRGGALARHFREAEGLSVAQIADRIGRSPATIKAYFHDRASAVKARHIGLCCGCGAYAQPRNGKGDAYRCCKRCPALLRPAVAAPLLL